MTLGEEYSWLPGHNLGSAVGPLTQTAVSSVTGVTQRDQRQA